MYCVKCGVKLADTEKQCPLCDTVVFHPEIAREAGVAMYPAGKNPAAPSKPIWPLIIFSAAFLLPIFIVLLCDLQLNGALTWAGYVVGALITSYVILVLPMWFRNPNPVIFVPVGFATVALYVLYINFATGGDWFLPFALPVTAGVCAIVTTAVALIRYVKRGKLYIFGGAFIAAGILTLLTEYLINYTFGFSRFIGWSLYPLTTFALLGGILIFLAICRPARESMERLFFI